MRRFYLLPILFGILAFTTTAQAAPRPSFKPARGPAIMPRGQLPNHSTNPLALPNQSSGGKLGRGANTPGSNGRPVRSLQGQPSTTRTGQLTPRGASGGTSSSGTGQARGSGSNAQSQISDFAQRIQSLLGSGSGGSGGQDTSDPSAVAEPRIGGLVDQGVETSSEWGMKVNEVFPERAAANADLRVGDIILDVGGKRIQSFEELAAALAETKGPVEFVFINGENKKIEKMMVAPIDGKIGIKTDPVEID